VDELEIRRAIHARYKAKCLEVRELIAENAGLRAQVRQLEFTIDGQRAYVELAEQVLGLTDAPPSADAP
jgi:ribosomal protein L23